jgi:hypothetical protein
MKPLFEVVIFSVAVGLGGCDRGGGGGNPQTPQANSQSAIQVSMEGESATSSQSPVVHERNMASNSRTLAMPSLNTPVLYQINIETPGNYELVFRYSNDDTGVGDTVAIAVNGTNLSSVKTLNTRSPAQTVGAGWNSFAISNRIQLGRLEKGINTISLTLIDSDGFGLEIDSISLALVNDSPRALIAQNSSKRTLCAEEDNVAIPIFSSSTLQSFTLVARHPNYDFSIDSCAANFVNCSTTTNTDFTFTPDDPVLYDDGRTVIQAVREAKWFLPRTMKASVSGRIPFDAHFIRVRRRIEGTTFGPLYGRQHPLQTTCSCWQDQQRYLFWNLGTNWPCGPQSVTSDSGNRRINI